MKKKNMRSLFSKWQLTQHGKSSKNRILAFICVLSLLLTSAFVPVTVQAGVPDLVLDLGALGSGAASTTVTAQPDDSVKVDFGGNMWLYWQLWSTDRWATDQSALNISSYEYLTMTVKMGSVNPFLTNTAQAFRFCNDGGQAITSPWTGGAPVDDTLLKGLTASAEWITVSMPVDKSSLTSFFYTIMYFDSVPAGSIYIKDMCMTVDDRTVVPDLVLDLDVLSSGAASTTVTPQPDNSVKIDFGGNMWLYWKLWETDRWATNQSAFNILSYEYLTMTVKVGSVNPFFTNTNKAFHFCNEGGMALDNPFLDNPPAVGVPIDDTLLKGLNASNEWITVSMPVDKSSFTSFFYAIMYFNAVPAGSIYIKDMRMTYDDRSNIPPYAFDMSKMWSNTDATTVSFPNADTAKCTVTGTTLAAIWSTGKNVSGAPILMSAYDYVTFDIKMTGSNPFVTSAAPKVYLGQQFFDLPNVKYVSDISSLKKVRPDEDWVTVSLPYENVSSSVFIWFSADGVGQGDVYFRNMLLTADDRTNVPMVDYDLPSNLWINNSGNPSTTVTHPDADTVKFAVTGTTLVGVRGTWATSPISMDGYEYMTVDVKMTGGNPFAAVPTSFIGFGNDGGAIFNLSNCQRADISRLKELAAGEDWVTVSLKLPSSGLANNEFWYIYLVADGVGQGDVYFRNMRMTTRDFTDIDAKIQIIERLLLKKADAENSSLFLAANVDSSDAAINILDLLTAKQRILSNEGNISLIQPVYGNDRDAVTAVATVQQFGAAGNGATDDTTAFQDAMDYAGGLGGGAVYVPAGHYKITGRLIIPYNVQLTGELDTEELAASKEITGTVLDLYYGKNTPTGQSAIEMRNGSSIQYMALWYPEQQITENTAVPYSYTIGGSYVTGGVSYGVDIENIVLVNSYNGIKFGPDFNVLQTIRNVYGTPLNNGVFMDTNADLARVEGIYFSPSYWANSGLQNAPDRMLILGCTWNHAVAYIAERVDWTYIFDLVVDGYQTGLLFRTSSVSGASNGSLYNLDISDCFYGIDISRLNEMGILISGSSIFTNGTGDSAAIRTGSVTATTLNLTDCELGSAGINIIKGTAGDTLSLSNCTLSFIGNDAHNAAIYSDRGAVSAAGLHFQNVTNAFHLGASVPSAKIVNCDNNTVIGNTAAAKISTDGAVPAMTAPQINLKQASNHKPTGNGFMDLTGRIKAGADISFILQDSIDFLAATGGIVYLPSGTFRLDSPITIKSGVEVRGALDAPVYSTSKATVLETSHGKGNAGAAALVTMMGNAGIVGITFVHDQNSSAVVPYPYTIRGNGSDIYIRNIAMNSCYNGIDLATYRCDRHHVQSFSGVILNKGIIVGAGSQNGVIRDVLVNPVYWGGSGGYEDAMTYATANTEGLTIGSSTGQLLYSTFFFGAKKGLVFTEGCNNAVSVAHGTDGCNTSVYTEGTCGTISLINHQSASWQGANSTYVTTASTFNGTLNIHGMSGWGAANGPTIALNLQGGTVNIRQCNILLFDTQTVNVNGAAVSLIGTHFDKSMTPLKAPVLYIGSTAQKLLMAATVFDLSPNITNLASSGVYCGPDTN